MRTLQLAHTATPRTFYLVVAGTFVAAFLSPLGILATAAIIDGVAVAQREQQSLLSDERLWLPLGLITFVAFAQRALDRLMDRQWEIFADSVHLEIKVKTLQTVSHADADVIEDPQFYDTLVRSRSDATWRPHALTLTCIHMFSSMTTLAALVSALALLHPLLMVLGILSVLPTIVVRAGINEKIYRLFWKAGAREREHDYLYNLTSQPRFHAEQKAFDLSSTLIGRVRALSTARLNDKRRLYGEANRKDVVGAAFAALILLVAFAFLIERGSMGTLSVGQVAASLAAFGSLTGHLAAMLGALLAVDQHAPFLLELYGLFDKAPVLPVSTSPKALPERVSVLALDNASFSYPSSKEPVLDGVSLSLKRGEKVALVGENGAGKSTVVKLLLRFFDPQQGRVVVDGVDVREVDPVALRARVGVLFQEYARFELPVGEGLRLGRAHAPLDEDKAWRAIEAGRAKAVVDELGGLSGVAGRVLEGGHDLSGGQWQRLALARLVYRDADVWILDEPTANLDPAAEAAVFDELFALAKDRAVLVISHRFATVRACDRICVLEHGRVIEEGSHDVLLEKNGRYAALFRLQQKGYA
ncbi:MAG: ABC transporter ATP-binding protein [Deltaproteobacteria bacterium]|nr:ABC transporter ATP-binding protein [Deltaproteobacteria bacterium]